MMDGSKFLGTVELPGKLYAVSSYPALVEGGDKTHVAELYEVPDHVFDMVDRMEIGAGYKRMDVTVECDGETRVAGAYYAGPSLAKFCEEHRKEIEKY